MIDLEKAKIDKDYYWENFEDIMLAKIDAGKKLTTDEIRSVALDYDSVEEIQGESLRWVQPITTIVELHDRYICIKWYRGLTEMQEDEFDEQPYEVKPVTRTETITVTDWERV